MPVVQEPMQYEPGDIVINNADWSIRLTDVYNKLTDHQSDSVRQSVVHQYLKQSYTLKLPMGSHNQQTIESD